MRVVKRKPDGRGGFVDHTGKQFGRWTVLHLTTPPPNNNKLRWVCECECGNRRAVLMGILLNGKSTGCSDCGRKTIAAAKTFYVGEYPWNNFMITVRNAESRGYTFKLDMEYLWALYLEQEGRCALSGVPIEFRKSGEPRHATTASVDRIDNTQGYVKGNVQWVHKHINRMKMDHTQTEFVEWCKLIANHSESKDRV